MIDRLERLINLVIALRETRRPMPADEIRRRVAGYGQDEYASFRRMFERDKADLRALGVPLDTVPEAGGDDVDGYRIDPESYDLPPVRFPDDELAALALAVEATGLRDDAATGLQKLAIGREGPDATGGAGDTPGMALRLHDPNRTLLAEAQLTRTRVRFRYDRNDGTRSDRVVEPHGMVFRAGHWYLVGLDRNRGSTRSFRLDRIDGSVRTTGRAGAYPLPEVDLKVEDVLPPARRTTIEATVAAPDAVSWKVARRARGEGRRLNDGRTAYTVLDTPDVLLAWIVEEFPDIELLDPAELRQALRDLATGFTEPGGAGTGDQGRHGEDPA